MAVESTIKEFTPGKLTHERLNEVVRAVNGLVTYINTIFTSPESIKRGLPVPCKITDIVAGGKYYADAYLPPYQPSEPNPLSISDLVIGDLNTRTIEVILWNLAEINGGSALSVGDVVDASIAGFDPSGYPLMKTGGTGGGGGGSSSQWYKIKTAADSNGIAVCNTYDGTTAGSDDIPIKVWTVKVAGQLLYASQPAGGTGKTFGGNPVTWRQDSTNYELFRVQLVAVGGSPGVLQTSKSTRTYTVKDVTGAFTLATPVSLTGFGTGFRQLDIQLADALQGMAHLSDAGAVVLIYADEGPSSEQVCT